MIKRAVITIGPRGAGKSTFCSVVVQQFPDVILVSRDAILREMFGSSMLNPYTGAHFAGMAKMWEVVSDHLSSDPASIILDCWNGYPEERTLLCQELRKRGAGWVGGWRFVTAEATCLEWREKQAEEEDPVKEGKWGDLRRVMRRDAFVHDYRLYHSFPVDSSQGFDYICEIDPSCSPDLTVLWGK